jgi:hypothetical protein
MEGRRVKAAICYLRRSIGPTGFGESIRDFAVADFLPSKRHPQGRRLVEDRWVSLQWPPYPNTGRTHLTRHCLDKIPAAEIIFSLDDDMEFEPWQAYAIADLIDPVKRPIISALYFAHNGEERGKARPLIAREADGGTIWDYRPDTLELSDVVGMGFCAIHVSALKEWRALHGDTWFDYQGTGLVEGFQIEDTCFCSRMRSLGKPIYVHTGVEVGHLKTKRIGAEDYRLRRALEQANR